MTPLARLREGLTGRPASEQGHLMRPEAKLVEEVCRSTGVNIA